MADMDQSGLAYSEDEFIEAKWLDNGNILVMAYDMSGSAECAVAEFNTKLGDFPGAPEFSGSYGEAQEFFDRVPDASNQQFNEGVDRMQKLAGMLKG